jgi:hypothetical protein
MRADPVLLETDIARHDIGAKAGIGAGRQGDYEDGELAGSPRNLSGL